MMSPVVEREAFRIEENVVTEELWFVTGDFMVRLPEGVIEAIRGLSAKQAPHLRKARKEVFSERSRKGWITRRSEREDRKSLEELAAEPVADKPDEYTPFNCPAGRLVEDDISIG